MENGLPGRQSSEVNFHCCDGAILAASGCLVADQRESGTAGNRRCG
jgi:hypothetical protein